MGDHDGAPRYNVAGSHTSLFEAISLTHFKKPTSQRFNKTSMGRPLFPGCGYPFVSVESASNLTIDSSSSIRIISKINGEQATLFEGAGFVEGP
jgi:hypothetical protein